MNESKTKIDFFVWIIAALLLALIGFSLGVSYLRGKVAQRFTTCLLNLKEIGNALNSYHNDHDKMYPSSLSELIPKYLQSIPTCPAAKKDVYSQGYQVSSDLKTFSFYCKGHYHRDASREIDYPRFYSKFGLVTSKDSESKKLQKSTVLSTITSSKVTPTPTVTPTLIKE